MFGQCLFCNAGANKEPMQDWRPGQGWWQGVTDRRLGPEKLHILNVVANQQHCHVDSQQLLSLSLCISGVYMYQKHKQTGSSLLWD